MVKSVVALVIDYRSSAGAELLATQIATADHGDCRVAVVHVDNGNAAPVALSARERELGVRLVRNGHNGGYASGIRGALAQLDASGEAFDAVWMLNSDIRVDPACLRRLVRILRACPGVGALGPNVLRGLTGRVWGAVGVVSPWRGTTAMRPAAGPGVLPRWSYIPGCSILVRRKAYDSVGGIPDRYGMYYEETELCVQLQKHGWELWVEPSAEAYHEVDSMEEGIPARHFAFYFTRNNLYFWRRNFGIPWWVQLPRTLLVVTLHLVVPLRRARTPGEAMDRLRYIAMGLADSIPFLSNRFTPFEQRHFELQPPDPGREAA